MPRKLPIIRSLKPDIREKVATLEIKDFATLANKCRIVEKNVMRRELEGKKRNQEVYFSPPRNNETENRKFQKGNGYKGKQVAQGPPPMCLQCSKRHDNLCIVWQSTCFRCRKPGHIARNCQTSRELILSKLHAQGRVFALSQEEANQSPGLIQGMILIYNFLANALFNLGATHLFISQKCAKGLNLKKTILLFDLKISTYHVYLNYII